VVLTIFLHSKLREEALHSALGHDVTDSVKVLHNSLKCAKRLDKW